MSKKTYHSISIPSECLSDIDRIKFFNRFSSRGSVIEFIIKEYNRLKVESAQSISKDEFTVCQKHIDMMHKGHVC